MIIYHFCFDLNYFQFVQIDFYHDPFWLHARTFILSSFLALVGVSLALATRSGLNKKSYAKRLSILIGSAILISITTKYMYDDRFIFFGVLHFIALASILGLVFTRFVWLNLACGLALLYYGNTLQSPWFDEIGRRWIGLMTYKPPTEDYVPLLPWFGVVLLGLFTANLILQYTANLALPKVESNQTARWLAWAGRHSLLIYLIHQPILMGILYLITKLIH